MTIKKLQLALNEDETKCLLLMIQAASEVNWTDIATRLQLQELSKNIEAQVNRQLPNLKDFLIDKNAPMENFA